MPSRNTGAGPAGDVPTDAPISVIRHRVGFYETDAMGIVHHARYLYMLERARVLWLDEHDRPYREYVAKDLHYAVTGVEVSYRSAARFDDFLEVTSWLEWVRGASLEIGYVIRAGDRPVVAALTRHAMVDGSGAPVRIPAERRASLSKSARRR